MSKKPVLAVSGEAEAVLRAPGGDEREVTVFGTEAIRRGFDDRCLEQAMNARRAPGVSRLVLNPDAHVGYGAPVGSVLVSPTHIYPGPIGVDIKCSMSLLQLDLPASELAPKPVRRALIRAICERTPTGPGHGQRSVAKSRRGPPSVNRRAVIEGGSRNVCANLGIPDEWRERCEDSHHTGVSGTADELEARLDRLDVEGVFKNLDEKLAQLGSYGGGNHFGECEAVSVDRDPALANVAERFGLRDGCTAFLSHCGSRGFGHLLATNQFRGLQSLFGRHGVGFPGGDRDLVYARLGTPEATDYLADMALGANFATVNHLLINSLVLDAFREVFPGVKGELVYFISHNIARREMIGSESAWVHRKGATRAYPPGNPSLRGTPFHDVGHPILLPGNPRDGSVVMVARPGAEKSCFSVNHGAGRALGRRAAKKSLDQRAVDAEFDALDILSNSRNYPLDEAPAAYKDFHEVLRSVERAGLASTVARLSARFVIKDSDSSVPAD